MKLFGTDGIRGIFGSEQMNPELGFKFGAALADFCRKRNWPLKIVIGRDTRESGPAMEEAVAAGVQSEGAEALVVGVLPTPGVAYLVREQLAGAGIVISASHNPTEYNGLKPFKQDGTKLDDAEEKEVEGYITDQTNFAKATGNKSGGKKAILHDAKERYASFILNKVSEILEDTKLKIVLDCANGATYQVARDIFGKVVANIDVIFSSPDGKNINANCGSQYTENLKNEVVERGADLGLAFDGDGDRLIAVDEKGSVLTGDQIIFIIAKMLKEKGELKNDLVVTTVMSNLGFVNDLKKNGIHHIATAVGDRPVFFEMNRNEAVLGGEESGHIIFSGFHPAGDGIIGGLLLIMAMDHFGKSLSQLAQEVTLFPKLLVNVEVKSKPDIDSIPEIFSVIKEVENKLGEYGRVLVRYSGTENLCRVMIEGRDENKIAQDAEKIARIIKNYLA